MEPVLRLCDSYEWYEDLFCISIEEAGMLLFSKLGYVECEKHVLLPASNARRFIYSMPLNRVVNNADRKVMSTIETASHLFTFNASEYPSGTESVPVYAVEIECASYERSAIAHDIHALISKFTNSASIVCFRHEKALLLSFLYMRELGRVAIYLSDWFTEETEDEGQLERMHVGTMLLESAWDCFDCFAYEAMREYYKNPLSRYSVRYYLLDAPDARSDDWPIYYSSAEIEDAVDEYMQRYIREYGDDYVEGSDREIDAEEEFNLEDLEWELQQAEAEAGVEADAPGLFELGEDEAEGDDEPVVDLELGAIPDSVMADPIALLEWINGNHVTAPTTESRTAAEHGGANLREPVLWLGPERSDDIGASKGIDGPERAGASGTARGEQKGSVGRNALAQPAAGRAVPWQSSLVLDPPEIGARVWHAELGEGIVVRSTTTQVRARFSNGAVRLFVFPAAFERGQISLLERTG